MALVVLGGAAYALVYSLKCLMGEEPIAFLSHVFVGTVNLKFDVENRLWEKSL